MQDSCWGRGGGELMVKVVVVSVSTSTHSNTCVPSKGGLWNFRSSQIATDTIWDKISILHSYLHVRITRSS